MKPRAEKSNQPNERGFIAPIEFKPLAGRPAAKTPVNVFPYAYSLFRGAAVALRAFLTFH